jgi:hypothetical protein
MQRVDDGSRAEEELLVVYELKLAPCFLVYADG